MSSENQILSDAVNYYSIKMSALSEYSTMIWNRFNWFLTLQVAILGFYFSQLTKIDASSVVLIGVPVAGLIVAILWAIMGIEDYLSIRRHGKRTKELDKHVRGLFLNQEICIYQNDQNGRIEFKQTSLLYYFPMLTMTSWIVIYIFVATNA
jgi:hypothetical protein